MKCQLKIKCKTAVCPASGESWGGFIDNDVVHDELGLPYIPAKRIKGILVEHALDIAHSLKSLQGIDKSISYEDQNVYNLFGLQGSKESCPFIIDNAYLSNHDELSQWLKWAEFGAPMFVSPERVLSLYTSTRTQTAIGSDSTNSKEGANMGGADEHSLRIHRVLRRGLCFYANIEILEEKYLDLLILAVQVSRHLGLNRNRGLGWVSMSLIDDSDDPLFKETSFLEKFKMEA